MWWVLVAAASAAARSGRSHHVASPPLPLLPVAHPQAAQRSRASTIAPAISDAPRAAIAGSDHTRLRIENLHTPVPRHQSCAIWSTVRSAGVLHVAELHEGNLLVDLSIVLLRVVSGSEQLAELLDGQGRCRLRAA